jgi:hypothetical protein
VLCGGISVLAGVGSVSGGVGAAAISGPDDVDPGATVELSDVDDEMLGDETSNVGADDDDPESLGPDGEGAGSLGDIGDGPGVPAAVAAPMRTEASTNPAATAMRTALCCLLKVRLLVRPRWS